MRVKSVALIAATRRMPPDRRRFALLLLAALTVHAFFFALAGHLTGVTPARPVRAPVIDIELFFEPSPTEAPEERPSLDASPTVGPPAPDIAVDLPEAPPPQTPSPEAAAPMITPSGITLGPLPEDARASLYALLCARGGAGGEALSPEERLARCAEQAKGAGALADIDPAEIAEGDYAHILGPGVRGLDWAEALAAVGLTDPRLLTYDARRSMNQVMFSNNFADDVLGRNDFSEPSWSTIHPSFYMKPEEEPSKPK